ncbi:hypothetical protein E2562_038538 [Oryza meyeriana var. granulata]|uniref:Uncharacterized protein n=1 Tax=Oryza meyeriana var. granulata TaxID=110450 RepID=A0A6G1BQZ1_9ORYZ|nr:hypothetical protein E2562_038538 [Oryza meyeriana var. granulata]
MSAGLPSVSPRAWVEAARWQRAVDQDPRRGFSAVAAARVSCDGDNKLSPPLALWVASAGTSVVAAAALLLPFSAEFSTLVDST